MSRITNIIEIKAGLQGFITTGKAQNALVTKLGASAVALAMDESDARPLLNEMLQDISKALPRQAVQFKAWILATSPFVWDSKGNRLKFSVAKSESFGTSQEVYDSMLIENFENFKREATEKKPITFESIMKRIEKALADAEEQGCKTQVMQELQGQFAELAGMVDAISQGLSDAEKALAEADAMVANG